ncbi:DUF5687 family protein [Algivirga pacifica]|uniref:DUF5687 family protein n=2 Tax=Algivirga pacifica TaxID=1162670 RepID=A0ABP9CZM5_9BACT
MGFVSGKLLKESFGEEQVLLMATKFLLLYLLANIGLRGLMQSFPQTQVRPYLLLQVSKRKLMHFPLLLSLGSRFNYYPFLVILPFYFKTVLPNETLLVGINWLTIAVTFLWATNYYAFALKKYFSKSFWTTLGVILPLAAFTYLEVSEWTNVTGFLSTLLLGIAEQPWGILIGVILLLKAYVIAFKATMSGVYLDRVIHVDQKLKIEESDNSLLAYLNRFGNVGYLMAEEIKTLWRHKRSKNTLLMSVFLLFYGLIFYTQDMYKEQAWVLVFVPFMTMGVFALNYGQMIFAWESTYFDFLLTQKIKIRDYIEAKYWLMILGTTLGFLGSVFYAYFGWHILWINLAVYFYLIGIVPVYLIYFGTYNQKRLDLSGGNVMNFQGVSAHQFLLNIPIALVPVLFYVTMDFFGLDHVGLGIIGGLGVMSLLLKNYWIKDLEKQFHKRKYIMATGFRKQ